jgi:glycosyltransferase involved in cell wall biosynthesis
MRIAIVSPYHLSAYTGGQERYAHQLATCLARTGHQVTYLTGRYHKKPQDYVVITLPLYHVFGQPVPGIDWFLTLVKIRPRIAHAFGFSPVFTVYTLFLWYVFRIPSVLARMASSNHPRRFTRLLARLFINLSLACYQGVSTLTPAHALRLRLTFPHKPIRAIPPALPSLFYQPSISPQKSLPLIRAVKNLLFVSVLDHHHYYKGLDILIAALPMLKSPVHVIVVGDGNSRLHYQRLTKKKGVEASITFTGFLPDDQLYRLYHSVDGCILPSTSASEGFGLVLLEAMSLGTPVITTDVAGIAPFLTDHSFALIIPPNRPDKLAHAIDHLPEKKKVAAAAVKFARSFTAKHLVGEALKLYQEVLTHA